MPQVRGYKSFVAFDFESTFGQDPGTPDLKKLPINSSSLSRKIELEENPAMQGSRSMSEPFQGLNDVGGSLDLPLWVEQIGFALRAMFGAPNTTGAGPYTHVFKEGPDQPSMVIEQGYPEIPQYQKFNGCKVNGWSMNVSSDQIGINTTLDILGASEGFAAASIDATPTDFAEDRFLFRNAAIQQGGVNLANCTNFDFNIGFNLDEKYSIGGGGNRGSLTEGAMSIDGNLSILFENMTLLNLAIAGTKTTLRLTFTQGANSLDLYFPVVKFTVKTPDLSQSKAGVMVDLGWKASYDGVTENSAIVATLINNESAY